MPGLNYVAGRCSYSPKKGCCIRSYQPGKICERAAIEAYSIAEKRKPSTEAGQDARNLGNSGADTACDVVTSASHKGRGMSRGESMYSVESSGGRLSPLNISDPLLRAELFREIRLAQTDVKYRGEAWGYYVVQPADALSPELVAWKVYGLDTLKWVVLIASGIDDSRESLPTGERIYLPSTAWLRERIKHYSSFEVRK